MKIRKSVLLEALKVPGKIVAQTSPMKLVRSVRFVGDSGRMWLMATDGVECVAVSVECEVAEAVDFAVEYRALRELSAGGSGYGSRWFAAYLAGRQPFAGWRHCDERKRVAASPVSVRDSRGGYVAVSTRVVDGETRRSRRTPPLESAQRTALPD